MTTTNNVAYPAGLAFTYTDTRDVSDRPTYWTRDNGRRTWTRTRTRAFPVAFTHATTRAARTHFLALTRLDTEYDVDE